MPFWRQILPVPTRRWLRRGFDRQFCRPGHGVRKLGTTCAWAVIEERMQPGASVLSGGAGRDISFEVELAGRRGCQVALFDPSPTGQDTWTALVDPPKTLRYFPDGLAGESARCAFARPADPAEGSFRQAGAGAMTAENKMEFACLGPREALQCAGLEQLELLKLDIEGFEYDFIASMLGAGIRPVQIAVEFHHFLPGIPLMKTLTALRQLRAAGYRILHKDQCDYLFVHRGVLTK